MTATAFLIDSTSAAPAAHSLTLAAMQETVGGYIEPAFTLPSPTRADAGIAVTGYVNEEGLLLSLPIASVIWDGATTQPLAGPMLVCGLDQNTGETVPLDAAEIAWLDDHCYLIRAVGSLESVQAVHALDLSSL